MNKAGTKASLFLAQDDWMLGVKCFMQHAIDTIAGIKHTHKAFTLFF